MPDASGGAEPQYPISDELTPEKVYGRRRLWQQQQQLQPQPPQQQQHPHLQQQHLPHPQPGKQLVLAPASVQGSCTIMQYGTGAGKALSLADATEAASAEVEVP